MSNQKLQQDIVELEQLIEESYAEEGPEAEQARRMYLRILQKRREQLEEQLAEAS